MQQYVVQQYDAIINIYAKDSNLRISILLSRASNPRDLYSFALGL